MSRVLPASALHLIKNRHLSFSLSVSLCLSHCQCSFFSPLMLFETLLFACNSFPIYKITMTAFSTLAISCYGHNNSPRIKGLLGIIYAEMNNAQKHILSAASLASYLACTELVPSNADKEKNSALNLKKKGNRITNAVVSINIATHHDALVISSCLNNVNYWSPSLCITPISKLCIFSLFLWCLFFFFALQL